MNAAIASDAVKLSPGCAGCARVNRCLLVREQFGIVGPVLEYALTAGQRLIDQGEPLRHLLVVKVGLALLRRQYDATLARTIAVIGPGQGLGLSAIFPSGTAVFEVVALTDLRVCARPVGQSQVSLSIVSATVNEGIRVLETLADWAAIARLPTAVQRVEATLHRIATVAGTARIELPDRSVIAELAVCAPETVSRAIAALVRAGRVQRNGGRHVVVAPPQSAQPDAPYGVQSHAA